MHGLAKLLLDVGLKLRVVEGIPLCVHHNSVEAVEVPSLGHKVIDKPPSPQIAEHPLNLDPQYGIV